MYLNPENPICVHTPYSIKVEQTLIRILTTINYPKDEEFPLVFRIADGLDGSGCHTGTISVCYLI